MPVESEKKPHSVDAICGALAVQIGHLTDHVKKDLPTSRERSLVITKLDEARLWLVEIAALVDES